MKTTGTTMAVALMMVAAVAGTAYGQAQDYRWIGADAGGSWNDAANWWDDSNTTGIPGVNDPGDTVDMEFNRVGARIIMMDVPGGTSVASVSGLPGNGHGLILDANLTIGALVGNTSIEPNEHTLTLGAGRIYHLGVPRTSGTGGLIIKNTTGLVYMGWQPQWYTGDYRVDDGTLKSTDNQAWKGTGDVTVNDGGTLEIANNRNDAPDTISLNGAGFASVGAMKVTQDFAPSTDITIDSNATISVASGRTFSLSGNLAGGTNELTLIGGGTLAPSAVHSFSGEIVIDDGTLSVPGELTNVTKITIEAGTTLIGTAAHFPSATVVNNGGTWLQPLVSNWVRTSGATDANWSIAANWAGGVPDVNDANTEVFMLTKIMPSPYNKQITIMDLSGLKVAKLTITGVSSEVGTPTIRLENDLHVVEYDGTSRNGRIDINGHTLTVESGQMSYVESSDSNAIIIKEGTGEVWLRSWYGGLSGTSYNGDIVINNGTVKFSDGEWWGPGNSGRTRNVTVNSGGTLRIYGRDYHAAGVVTLNGTGFDGTGALRVTESTDLETPLAIATDSNLYISSGQTFTLTTDANLHGPGILTLSGGGTLKMDNTWDFVVGSGNPIIAEEGIVDITDANLSITGTPTESEYVIVDFSSATGSVLGTTFNDVLGLLEGWSIDYDGTDTYDDSIVLVVPAAFELGDMNGDGNTDNLDISPFVDALTDTEAAFDLAYPGGEYWAGDVNEDGNVDNLDISPFVELLTGGGSEVPEPATMVLLAAGGLGALLRRRNRR